MDPKKVKGYKITKYNPAHFGPGGRYTEDTWTSISDVGKMFKEVILSLEEYERVEDAYLTAIRIFADKANVDTLRVCDLEVHEPIAESVLRDGQYVSLARAIEICRQMLREQHIWCRLEESDNFYVHIGYDYYMYLGINVEVEVADAVRQVTEMGLFVEEYWPSPYLME